MIISEHLSLAELISSDSVKRRGISNMPTPEHIANLKALAEHVFEPIRAHFRCPIFISSGYRSDELNRALGGAKTSDHLFGRALDLDQQGHSHDIKNKEVFNYIKDNLKFKQLIWEGGNEQECDWVHISYDKNNLKNQILRAIKKEGKMIYEVY